MKGLLRRLQCYLELGHDLLISGSRSGTIPKGAIGGGIAVGVPHPEDGAAACLIPEG